MKHINFPVSIVIGLLVSTGAIAANVKITGSIPTTVHINQQDTNRLTASSHQKQISLDQIELSPEAQDYLAKQASNKTLMSENNRFSTLPPNAYLAMNHVPVLDQGVHGTCVTFATTGAIDAAYGSTDYISQLCNLELGAYIEAEAKKAGKKYYSGWDGSFNELVLAQIQNFGIISMKTQKEVGCGNKTRLVKEYPLTDEYDTGVQMSDTDFARHSEAIMKDIYSKKLLSVNDAYSVRSNMSEVLNKVKQALSNGNRVVFGTALDTNDELKPVNGATGTYNKVANDSWVVTPKVRKDAKIKGKIRSGHAMVIVGYDDNAEIIGSDAKHTRHKGVLTLRNSWGSEAGNKGEYYMSYEYFKLLADEAFEISAKPFN